MFCKDLRPIPSRWTGTSRDSLLTSGIHLPRAPVSAGMREKLGPVPVLLGLVPIRTTKLAATMRGNHREIET
jgi:hypothetical protein